MNRFVSLSLTLIGLVLVISQVLFGSKIGRNAPSYEVNVHPTSIRFKEVSGDIGPNFPWTSFKQTVDDDINAGVIFRQPAVLAVGDLQGDSYMDLVLLNSTAPHIHIATFDPKRGSYVRREDLEKRIHLALAEEANSFPTAILLTDADRDGKLDLLMGFRKKCPLLFREIANPKTKPKAEAFAAEICPPASLIAEADISLDGNNDYVFAQYLGELGLPGQVSQKLNMKGLGGKSTVLIRSDDLNFRSLIFPWRTFVTAIGFTYLEGAPSLAIFRGNDYSVDELHLLQDGHLVDITAERMPYRYHGYSGMNSEFFDINKDGLLDLFVTNIYAPPFQRRGNVLWIRSKDGTFTDRADDYGVRRCGFAWAGKFASFDNSENHQLLVVNGIWENEGTVSTNMGDYWNVRTLLKILPPFISTDALIKKQDLYLSSNDKWCVFDLAQRPGRNIAAAAGIAHKMPTRSMALVDIDNSGKMSFVTADINGKVSVFKNLTSSHGQWVGLSLQPYHMAIGARVTFESLNPRIVREIFPTNGYGAQSDPRIHLGLGPNPPSSIVVRITLSNGQSRVIHLDGLNTYHSVDVSSWSKKE